jgi:hypothetical protein
MEKVELISLIVSRISLGKIQAPVSTEIGSPAIPWEGKENERTAKASGLVSDPMRIH